MDKIKHCITLDMHAATAQTALLVKKGDTARKLIISLYADGKPYRPAEGCTAVLTAKKPDGNILYNACTISDGKIAYTFTPQTTSAAGDAECEVRVYDPDEQLITSPRFLLRVDPTVYNDGDAVESATEVSALTALVSETTALKNEVERKLADGEFVGAKGDKGDPGEKGDTGAAGAAGAAGRGISSFKKTGSKAASATSPAQVSDIWRMQYDDRTGVNVEIPRGARWFTCASLEALADSETVANYAVGAVMGDYLLSTVTGNVWRKAADTGYLWNAIGCIKGATGAKGDKGDPGDPGDPGTDAEVTLAKIFELYDGAAAQRALQITDAVPLKQRSGSVMAKVTLQVLRSFILDAVKKIYNDEGYSAALPDEMSADGVLALASDIPDVSGKQDKSTLAADVATAGFAKKTDVPTKLSELETDATHRVTTDTEKAAWNAKQPQHTTASVTIPASAWSGGTAAVSAEGVTAASTVVISPAPESMEVCGAARVYCAGQGAGSLTFSCTVAPTADIVMNVIMLD